ncbi:MAG: CDP-alcohol phosphatidyltransferase family protein [Deltaproteobacteria bacterium]|nr:CDP-alcohol phosphatidyltransferase family protein [Deltaproteobacteria bacterium]
MDNNSWKTKPTDRFVLKWIKLNLSARITPRLLAWPWLSPRMITISSALLGSLAGLVFALGAGWLAGIIAAAAQVLDGVDGQYARLTDRVSKGGAFWDSVLDRYADGALVIGLVVYLIRLPLPLPPGILIFLGSLALIGSNLVSYSSARAETLGLEFGPPTLASKGTRASIMILSAFFSFIWSGLPIVALVYLVIHPNATVMMRLMKTLD